MFRFSIALVTAFLLIAPGVSRAADAPHALNQVVGKILAAIDEPSH